MSDLSKKRESFGTQRRRSRSEVPNDLRRPLTPEEESPEASFEGLNGYAEQPGRVEESIVDGIESMLEPPATEEQEPLSLPRLRGGSTKGRKLVKKSAARRATLLPEQRLLILDTWKRSGLPARDFAALVGISKHTLYGWRKRFEEYGPEGLMDKPRGGPKGSRFLVGYGLYASQSSALVLEVLRSSIASYGSPQEILTDNGSQYVTWRGKSAFTKELQKRGIEQIVAKPRRPQTLGKIERFWGTLWRECIESAIFIDLGDARSRIGHFIDYYNFQRPHQGIDGLVPADRFFGAAPEVLRTLKERVILTHAEGERQEVDLVRPDALVETMGAEINELRIQLLAAQTREEIALAMPGILQSVDQKKNVEARNEVPREECAVPAPAATIGRPPTILRQERNHVSRLLRIHNAQRKLPESQRPRGPEGQREIRGLPQPLSTHPR